MTERMQAYQRRPLCLCSAQTVHSKHRSHSMGPHCQEVCASCLHVLIVGCLGGPQVYEGDTPPPLSPNISDGVALLEARGASGDHAGPGPAGLPTGTGVARERGMTGDIDAGAPSLRTSEAGESSALSGVEKAKRKGRFQVPPWRVPWLYRTSRINPNSPCA